MWIKDLVKKNQPIMVLAPMADMTDSPFCRIVKSVGGCDVVFREMVSSEAIVRENDKTWQMADFLPEERPIVQQIFGSDPHTMASAAARIVDKFSPDGIDINMGCPAHKIVGNFNGCALMKDPELAANIVRAVKAAISPVPVSVKIRLGWSDPDEFKKFIPVLEDAGAELITVHGRTKSQGYSGQADWERIRIAKEIARVPILANGDIHEPELFEVCLKETHADGASIARGALGNPWFFKLAKGEIKSEDVTLEERKRVILKHAALHEERYGTGSIVTFRKQLLWYFKGNKIEGSDLNLKELRTKLVQVKTVDEVAKIFSQM